MAIKVEFGKCAKCDENNPKQLKVCRKCGAPLPWAKAPKPQISKTSAPKSRTASTSPSIDWGLWGVGVFSFLVPIIGFFLYRSYSNSGDNKADAAIIGSILGILAIIARFALRAVAAAP
jgi:hypothetical protein